ncbi:class I SAM-dependent methyltransferase [Streptomyces sp. NPDC051172]|uniref:SAM-dependent methyltransferase n=1 Tax=Streptomyces sp. NPDC051172 TaxID=3155796 RepID=UPI00343AD0FA
MSVETYPAETPPDQSPQLPAHQAGVVPGGQGQDSAESGMGALIKSACLFMTLDACAKTGLLDRLRAGESTTEVLFAGLDGTLGNAVMRYLELQDVVMAEKGGTWRLTERGRLLTSEVSLAMLGMYGEAYGAVLSQSADLLTRRAAYGWDVWRDDAALGRHGATLFHRFHTQGLLNALAGADTQCLLDIGCGAGQLLIDLCVQDPGMRGVGLDISPEAIAVAREQAVAAGVADRVEFVVADAFDPESWPAVCHEPDTLVAVELIHELFREGEGRVVSLLDTVADLLRAGRKHFILGESQLCYDNRGDDSEYFLVCSLTGLGLPVREESWLDLIGRTQLQCLRTFTRSDARQRLVFYDLVRR